MRPLPSESTALAHARCCNRRGSGRSRRSTLASAASGFFFTPALAAFAFRPAQADADFTGRVVAVVDGDSLTVLDGPRAVRVRLWGIDAPEQGQPWSKRARSALAARALNRSATVVELGADRYGRTLGRVRVDGIDLAETQVADGYAWVYRRTTDDARWLEIEAHARGARRGLWAQSAPEPPWRYRERTGSGGDGAGTTRAPPPRQPRRRRRLPANWPDSRAFPLFDRPRGTR